MFIMAISFVITAIIFVILSIFIKGIWFYYIPAALLVVSLWLKIIQLFWDEEKGNLQTSFVQMDPSAAAGYISIISVIYGIICIFLGNWIAVVACVIIFALSLTMRFHHPC